MAGGQTLHQGIGLVGALELQQGQRLAIGGGVFEGVVPLLQAAVEVGEQPLRALCAIAHLDAHLGQPEVEAGGQGAAAIAVGAGAGFADPGLRQGVSQQHLGRLAGVAVLRRQFLEEAGHAHGIETGVIERLHADAVSFVLVVTGIVDGRLHGEPEGSLQRGYAGSGVDHRQRNGAHQTGQGHGRAARLRLHVTGDVALGHVGDFVSQHRGQLALVVGVEEEAGVHLDPPAEEGGRVDAGIIDEEEGKGETHPVGIGEQALTQIVDVFVQHGIIDDGQARPGKPHEGIAIAHFLLDGQGGNPGGADVGQLVVRLSLKGRAHQGYQQGKRCHQGGKTGHSVSISIRRGSGRIPLPIKAHKRCFILVSRP
ncbi:hypothetical protein D3C84_574090 [compost metagenome]